MTINTRPDSTSSNIAVRGPSPSITIAETTGSDNVVLQLLQDGLPLSSEGSEFRYESSTGNTYLRSGFSSGSLYLGAGSSSAAQIQLDSSGRLRMPYQPSFSGTKSGYGGALQQDPWLSNNVQINNGNHYNSGNGRFTCPISGYYFAIGHWIGNGGAYGYAGIKRNNGVIQFTHFNMNDPWQSITPAALVYCNAGDYITFYMAGGNTAGAYGDNHNGQTVFFVG